MVYAAINGHSYPLRLGMMAVKALEKNIAPLPEVVDMINSANDDIRNKALYGLAYAMIKNGLKVETFESENIPERPVLKSADHIEAIVSPTEEMHLLNAISEALSADSKTTIHAETSDTEQKNVVATSEI